jgi:hypothetical protein
MFYELAFWSCPEHRLAYYGLRPARDYLPRYLPIQVTLTIFLSALDFGLLTLIPALPSNVSLDCYSLTSRCPVTSEEVSERVSQKREPIPLRESIVSGVSGITIGWFNYRVEFGDIAII